MMSKNIDKDSDLSVKAEEYIEVISTEDERIKIIGEELANDTGRAIFGRSLKVWQAQTTLQKH